MESLELFEKLKKVPSLEQDVAWELAQLHASKPDLSKLDTRFDKLEEKIDKVASKLDWLIGVLLVAAIGAILAIIFK